MAVLNRQQFDDAYPTLIRYSGLALTIFLVLATVFGDAGVEWAGAWTAAGFMIVYKTVHNGAREASPPPEPAPEPPADDLSFEERWGP